MRTAQLAQTSRWPHGPTATHSAGFDVDGVLVVCAVRWRHASIGYHIKID
jgi:hypothetical protein